MNEYKINPNKLFTSIAKLSEAEMGQFLLASTLKMIEGKLECEWAKKVRLKNKKGKGEYTDEFKSFWELYPKKTGKGAAFSVWEDLDGSKQKLLEECTKALSWQVKQDQWTKDNRQFIPNPETYLRQRRFEDEDPDAGMPVDSGYVDMNGIWHH